MIYELRIYRCVPGRMPALLNRFETTTLGIWKRHGIRQAGFWTTLIGESNHDLHYMLAWESLAEREQKWNAFMSDPEWVSKRAESERDGPIIQTLSSQILTPTSFSAVNSARKRRHDAAWPAPRRPYGARPRRARRGVSAPGLHGRGAQPAHLADAPPHRPARRLLSRALGSRRAGKDCCARAARILVRRLQPRFCGAPRGVRHVGGGEPRRGRRPRDVSR